MRTVPLSQADCGMMLLAVPASKRVTETTQEFERIDVARRDRLQGDHDLRAHDDRIDALMRHRRVAAMAFDRDRDLIGRRHQRPFPETEGADRQRRQLCMP